MNNKITCLVQQTDDAAIVALPGTVAAGGGSVAGGDAAEAAREEVAAHLALSVHPPVTVRGVVVAVLKTLNSRPVLATGARYMKLI